MRQGVAADARLLAYHEAGHAVAAYVLKRPLGAVSLHPPEPAAAEAMTEVTTPEDGERAVISLLAGAEAEAILTGDCDWFAAAIDRERADALLARMLQMGYRGEPRDEAEAELVSALGDDPARRAWELLHHRTHALVHQDPVRAAIAALATALLAGGTLDPQEAQRAMRRGIASADPDLAE